MPERKERTVVAGEYRCRAGSPLQRVLPLKSLAVELPSWLEKVGGGRKTPPGGSFREPAGTRSHKHLVLSQNAPTGKALDYPDRL